MSDNKASDEQIDLVARTLAKQAKLGVKTITMSRLRDLVKGNLPLKHVPKLSNYIKINIIPALIKLFGKERWRVVDSAEAGDIVIYGNRKGMVIDRAVANISNNFNRVVDKRTIYRKVNKPLTMLPHLLR